MKTKASEQILISLKQETIKAKRDTNNEDKGPKAKIDEHNILGSLASSSQERYNTQFDVASDSNDAQRDVRHACCSRSCLSMLPHVFASQPLFAEMFWKGHDG